MEVVIAEGLWKRFGFTVALKDVSLRLDKGLHLLLGPNGSGKTTLIKLAAGMLKPSKGRIRVLGLDPWKSYAELSDKVAFAFEGLPLPWWLSGRSFLESVARMRGGSSKLFEAASELGVKAYWERPPLTYSSGMAKRLLLLLALGFEAEVYLLDEPFTLLDREAVARVSKMITALASEGRTVIVATHYVPRGFAEAVASLTRLESGEVVEHRVGEEAQERLRLFEE